LIPKIVTWQPVDEAGTSGKDTGDSDAAIQLNTAMEDWRPVVSTEKCSHQFI
jgi:hypothetical protein